MKFPLTPENESFDQTSSSPNARSTWPPAHLLTIQPKKSHFSAEKSKTS